MNISEFVTSASITMTAERTYENPNMGTDSHYPMDHWRCRLTTGRSRMTITFSMGKGHHGKEPTIGDVLDCLASDAACYENAGSFEDWCSEYGYDTDSRRAERTYKTVERQSVKLARFLGDSAYQTLLWDVERE